MTVWVTGSRGMLGASLGAQLDRLGIFWFGSDLEVDIADERAVRSLALERHPRVILNCAAYTDVDAAEADEPTAHKVNGQGPETLARVASQLGSMLVHVSTDYVFDGTLPKGEAYSETSATCPCNAYGRTKLSGEQGVARAFEQAPGNGPGGWLVLRTSWLFGTGRSSFVETMWRLMLEKDELNVVSDQVGRPTYAEDLASVMIAASGLTGKPRLPNGLWHYANTGAVSWHGYATAIRGKMLELGLPVTVKQIQPIPTEKFPRPATRPKNSVLSTDRIENQGGFVVRHWNTALTEHIQKRHQGAAK